MKRLFLVAAASMLFAGPAAAEVAHQDAAHQTVIAHDGTTLSVSYEPRTTTRLRQGGLGPRLPATCMWKSEISIERKLTDAAGRPVAALTRTVGTTKASEGQWRGYCADAQPHHVRAFKGDPAKMRAFLTQASEQDRPALETELASLSSVRRTVLR